MSGHDGLGEASPAHVAMERLVLLAELAHLAVLTVKDGLIFVVVVKFTHPTEIAMKDITKIKVHSSATAPQG